MRKGSGIGAAALTVALTLGLVGAAPVMTAGAGTVPAPTYTRTIGGPGHASLYPSGLEAGPNGTLFVADTGNDQIVKYGKDGKKMWRVGVRDGTTALGRFDNPRDLAYLDGKVYVADTGFNRVQILNADTGAVIGKWGTRFGSLIGISAGPDGKGGFVILACEDDRNSVSVFSPSGNLLRKIQTPVGRLKAQLNGPRDADTDSKGNIYVANYANDRMTKFSFTGNWILNWGKKGTGKGEFGRPYGVTVGYRDRIYVADSNNNRIQKFGAGGKWLKSWGREGIRNGRFLQLRRVAVGGGQSPDVYGADLWGNHVDRISHKGRFEHRYGGDRPRPGRFNEPSGLAIDSAIFVADSVNQRFQRFNTVTGALELIWGRRGWGKEFLDGFNWPRDITINDGTGTLWIADTKNSRVTEFGRGGKPTGRTFGTLGNDPTDLHWPFAVVSAGSDLVVADTFNNRIVRWDTASPLGPMWTAPGFSFPKDVAAADGFIYVADTNANRVVKLDATDGSQVMTIGGLHGPQGIALDGNGRIWVADTRFNQIRGFSPTGDPLVTFPAQSIAGSAHGKFNFPNHLEVHNGFLYVADEFNDRIEVFQLP
ncbi:MAG: tripartite motif-containing protein 71 [Gaiellales bacterium]|nr:tripartite motif-containing protein 71 [Gaiellales bacterium]